MVGFIRDLYITRYGTFRDGSSSYRCLGQRATVLNNSVKAWKEYSRYLSGSRRHPEAYCLSRVKQRSPRTILKATALLWGPSSHARTSCEPLVCSSTSGLLKYKLVSRHKSMTTELTDHLKGTESVQHAIHGPGQAVCRTAQLERGNMAHGAKGETQHSIHVTSLANKHLDYRRRAGSVGPMSFSVS